MIWLVVFVVYVLYLRWLIKESYPPPPEPKPDPHDRVGSIKWYMSRGDEWKD